MVLFQWYTKASGEASSLQSKHSQIGLSVPYPTNPGDN